MFQKIFDFLYRLPDLLRIINYISKSQHYQKINKMEPQTINNQNSHDQQNIVYEQRQPKHQGQYCIVHLQDLPQYQGYIQQPINHSDQNILQKMMTSPYQQNKDQFEIYWYKDTSTNHRLISDYNNFFGTFFDAYNKHKNIELVPDDIWIMITLYFSKYVEKNAEKLRNQFVKHDGKKQLIIWEYADTVEESLRLEKQWDYFFEQIILQIRKHTVQGVVDQLKCDFTTTNEIYELISTSVIMGALKQYFSYGRGCGECGISDIYFKGTLQDWIKVQKKLNALNKYDVDGVLKKYIKFVDIIIHNFIETYQGRVNLKWWNQMMVPYFPGSGSETVDGWILHFFGIYTQVDFSAIKKTLVRVPIKFINQITQKEKKLQMLTEWGSYGQSAKNTYKPNITLGIIQKKTQKE